MAGNVTILEARGDMYIIQTAVGVSTVPRTDYYDLKYAFFKGNRIFHTWEDGVRVMETYDDGIFNCYVGGDTMQVSDAERVAAAIKGNDAAAFREMFDEWRSIKLEEDVIKSIFGRYGHRIRIMPNGYVIDGVFMVDKKGAAHYAVGGGSSGSGNSGGDDPEGSGNGGGGREWRFLCLVSAKAMRPTKLALHGVGEVLVNSTTMVTASKMMFLLNPRSADGVFFSQLPDTLKDHVRALEAGRRE